MTRTTLLKRMSAAVVAAGVMSIAVGLQAQQAPPPKAGTSLGQVKIAKAFIANGQKMPAGTYTLRLTGEAPKTVVGQTPAESQWVEFVQGQDVKGKELATVLSPADAKKIVRSGQAPEAGSASVETLKGGDYIRVRALRSGQHYLVHLAVAS
jgi:hypothetical protein